MSRTRRMVSVLAMMAIAALLACGAAVAATVSGDASANEITGTESADTLYGYGGDDAIRGGSAADRIYGGDGNDELFGTDEHQSGISDGSQTSTDGNDRIEGETGDDIIVGASGADTLRGGPGADTIIEGPVNDAAQDTIEADPTYFSGGPPPDADTWNDKINVVSTPARKDIVNCGPGIDEVEADPLDVVNSNCENVERVDLQAPSTADTTTETGEVLPAVMSTDNEPAPPITEDSEEEVQGPPAGSGDASAAGYRSRDFRCTAAAFGRGSQFCAFFQPNRGEWVGAGAYYTSQNRWIYVTAWSYYRRVGSGHIRRGYDNHDWLYYSGLGADGALYARTSCWSKCWKTTYWDAWVDYMTD